MQRLLLIFIILSIIELAFYLALPKLLRVRGIDATRNGLFGLTMVFETQDEDGTPVRLLNVNGVFQSATYLSDSLWSELVCVYHRHMAAAIDEMGTARNVLVIGGGGYSLPKYLVTHTKHMKVCVIEIDPVMTELARKRFFLDRAATIAGDRLELINDDGFDWLRSSSRQFDVIVNDAFSAGRPVVQLATQDGAALIKSHLTSRGMYLANLRYPLEGRRSKQMQLVKQAFEREFEHVRIISENPSEPDRLGNNVLVACNQNMPAK